MFDRALNTNLQSNNRTLGNEQLLTYFMLPVSFHTFENISKQGKRPLTQNRLS